MSTQLVEQLMDLIETRRLSGLLCAVAEQCNRDRMTLISSGSKDMESINYLSDEENILVTASNMLKETEDSYEESRN